MAGVWQMPVEWSARGGGAMSPSRGVCNESGDEGSDVRRRASWLTVAAAAQPPARPVIDSASGLTIEQAIDEALRAEPMLGRLAGGHRRRARRSGEQAALWPNPDVMFEQREQVGGTDRQTAIGVELPLDVFRRDARIETADRAVAVAESSTREAERRVAVAVRGGYGQVLEAARRVDIADEVVAASRRTYELLRGRAQEGAAPPLERDVSLVELRRMESLHEQAAGRLASRCIGDEAAARTAGRRGPPAARFAGDHRRTRPSPGSRWRPPTGERADVQEAAAEVAMAQARTEEARQDAKPELGVFGSYMRMDQGFSQSGFNALGQLEPVHGRFHNARHRRALSIPVFDRGQGTIAAPQARARSPRSRCFARAASMRRARGHRRRPTRRRAAGGRSYSADGRALARRNLDVMQRDLRARAGHAVRRGQRAATVSRLRVLLHRRAGGTVRRRDRPPRRPQENSDEDQCVGGRRRGERRLRGRRRIDVLLDGASTRRERRPRRPRPVTRAAAGPDAGSSPSSDAITIAPELMRAAGIVTEVVGTTSAAASRCACPAPCSRMPIARSA